MTFAVALKSIPKRLTISGRFKTDGRCRVSELPRELFEGGAELRRAGARWAEVAEWVRSQGVSIADSTVRNEWKRYMAALDHE